MKTPNIHKEILPNGLKLVAIDLPGRRSLTSFLAIRSGSRYETPENNGIAHFLEHLVFKGTAKYPSNESVASAIERIGGTLNAWTDFDHTAYWNIVPAASWQVGTEMPFELAFAPQLRADDIERERGVIIEEIRMLQDDPARYVHDIATELLYRTHPLGQPIIGSEQTVTAMSAAQFAAYRQQFYHAGHSVFVVAGDLSSAPILEAVRARASAVATGTETLPKALKSTSTCDVQLLTKSTDQTHFVLGTADPNIGLTGDGDRMATLVLNTILGRGMSSRLFLNVREKQGLAYSIHSHVATLEDGGSLSVYGGVNTEKALQALEAVKTELRRLKEEPVSATELTDAKNYINGANDMQADQGMTLATWYGTDWLLGRWESHDELAQAINEVTAERIMTVAQQLFAPERMILAVIGPQTNASPFTELLSTQ
jgi:predicted Zn-dependent peptidase